MTRKLQTMSVPDPIESRVQYRKLVLELGSIRQVAFALGVSYGCLWNRVNATAPIRTEQWLAIWRLADRRMLHRRKRDRRLL